MPLDIIPEDADHHIASLPPNATPAYQARILKSRDCLAVLDPIGDIRGGGAAEGLFYQDTRYLSRLNLNIAGLRPALLCSTAIDDGITIRTDLANPDIFQQGRLTVEKERLHIERSQEIGPDVFFDTLKITNFATHTVNFKISIAFEADFADMFEVRGAHRERRGSFLDDKGTLAAQNISYEGLDKVTRRTELSFVPEPTAGSGHFRAWDLHLAPQQSQIITTTIRFGRDDLTSGVSLEECSRRAAAWRQDRRRQTAEVETNDRGFNDWLLRSRFDLEMLVTPTSHGAIAYAGTPWYSTAFGRDALITALQCLWLDPGLAAGTLRFLAATQAETEDLAADAEPGKILHETRQGEMALLGEVPFRRYYGSADSTPLFVMLAAAYFRRTHDLTLINEIWRSVEFALHWMEHYGDRDNDSLIEYGRRSSDGLVNQGWKDSGDSIFHADGSDPEPPIAMAEVQAYAYEAWKGAASLALALGEPGKAAEWEQRAERLKQRFQETFWIPELGTFAMALDGKKQPCKVLSSNAGHVLLSGLPTPEQARSVADVLMNERSFSGWGIRTIAEGEPRYNPMSYHNGSIWPHDNALIAMGFARFGFNDHLVRLVCQMFNVSRFVEQHRMPELFCGFPQKPGTGPASYPVACAPQAWAAASVFGLMGALLHLEFDPAQRRIEFIRPLLPPFLHDLRLRNLSMGNQSADIMLSMQGGRISFEIERHSDGLEIAFQ